MSDIKVISEHSIDLSLIKRDSKVLDLGCRRFGFAHAILEYVDKVCCADADSDVKTDDPRIEFINVGVGNRNELGRFIKFGNGTGNYFYKGDPLPAEHTTETVQIVTLDVISNYFGVEFWSLIKMDIEGAEFEILLNLEKPPARQISFELHLHTDKRRTIEHVGEMFHNLKRWYDIVVEDYSDKHGCGMNLWDCLAVLKEAK